MLENVGDFPSLQSGVWTDTMTTKLRRIRAVANTHRELPPVDMGHSVDEFFDYLAESTKAGSVLPNWHGELYLEVRY
jgi:alpha-mannosidase